MPGSKTRYRIRKCKGVYPSPPSDRAKKSFLFTTPNSSPDKARTVLITTMKVKPSPMLGATAF